MWSWKQGQRENRVMTSNSLIYTLNEDHVSHCIIWKGLLVSWLINSYLTRLICFKMLVRKRSNINIYQVGLDIYIVYFHKNYFWMNGPRFYSKSFIDNEITKTVKISQYSIFIYFFHSSEKAKKNSGINLNLHILTKT